MSFGKILIAILALLLTVGYLLSGFHLLGRFDLTVQSVRYFLIGIAVFIPMWVFFLRKKHFFSTFEHEFTHLLVGLIFLKKPASFTATETEGGVITMYGGNFMITLAPYFLPTFVFMLLPLFLVIKADFVPYYFAVLGFLTCYHILSTFQEFRYDQPDIIKAGKLFSTIFLIFGNLVCYGVILAFVLGGFKFCGSFLVGGFIELKDLAVMIIGKV